MTAVAHDLSQDVLRPLELVERWMDGALAARSLPANLLEAARYALLGGGKRLRPLLVLHCCAAVDAPMTRALPAAAAVEMIHAFSLVHDDLPALDNDDLRRGRPTLHRAHGEAMAILAGDGLMSLAVQVLLEEVPDPALGHMLARELVRANTAMIAGQVLDTLGGFAPGLTQRQRVELIHTNKTGALLRASCRLGALSGVGAANADSPAVRAVTRYGEAVGLMFQIVDDLLDVEQTTEQLGKRAAKDLDAGKTTYPGVMGIDAARAEVARLHREADQALAPLGAPAEALRAIADYMAVRNR